MREKFCGSYSRVVCHDVGFKSHGIGPLKRSSTREISFCILFLAAESLRNSRTFCWKLYTTTMDVADIVAVWAALAAKASNQDELLEISAPGTSVMAVDWGGRNMSGEVECRSQRLGMDDGILCVVGKSLGMKVLSHGFFTVGGGHLSAVPALGGGPCWYSPSVQSMTFLCELWGGHWSISLPCFFFISFEETAPCGKGSSVFGRAEETLIKDGSSVCESISIVRSW